MNNLKKIDKSKPFLAIIGCSYTHWSDSNCLGYSYPALIAKDYPHYNVVDLSCPGSSNDSAYLRLFQFEKSKKIKFSKVIFQVTHFGRELAFNSNWNWRKIKIWENGFYIQDNLIYTDGDYVESLRTMTAHLDDAHKKLSLEWLQNFFFLPQRVLIKYYQKKIDTDQMIWLLQKEINLINSVYGVDNVLIFPWHRNINSTPLYQSKDLQIYPSKNMIESIEELLGYDVFFNLGIDNAPHYDSNGHAKVYNTLSSHIDILLE